MQAVALISGGKDSFFSLLHCQNNGYDVVALANLYPPGEAEDVDSFMYQTVGHQVLPHYSTILGIPLYRAAIVGKSVNQELSYEKTLEDETEDLFQLLRKVLEAHPGVKAVSSGAILSTYQRTRVESVCQRLGLISLAWLWQRSQSLLLEEMAEVELDARIIKVASGGLDDTWLGKNVTSPEIREKLEQVRVKWGGNVAGEGGEFETIVLGCKQWPKRIELVKTEVVNEGGGVYRLAILESKVVDCASEKVVPRKPRILELNLDVPKNTVPNTRGTCSAIAQATKTTATTTLMANIHAKADSLSEELDQIFKVKPQSPITSTLLLLRSMDLFSLVNPRYNEFVAGLNPPSRVCIAVDLPEGVNVVLSTFSETYPRKALHVQSRSYWAPANVGPYSQAIAVDGVITFAGMIGLAPETMKIGENEAALALQNMLRVGREMGVGKYGWAGGVGYVTDGNSLEELVESWFESEEVASEFEHTGIDPLSEEMPPLLVVQVKELPLGATAEFAFIGLNHLYGVQREETDTYHTVYFGPHTLSWGIELPQGNACTTFYVTPQADLASIDISGASVVPVRNVWWKGKKADCGIFSRHLSRR